MLITRNHWMRHSTAIELLDGRAVALHWCRHQRGVHGVQAQQLGDGQENCQTMSGVGGTGRAYWKKQSQPVAILSWVFRDKTRTSLTVSVWVP